MSKPLLKGVTLVAIDCTPRANLAVRAIEKSLAQITPERVKLLTNDASLKYAETIAPLNSMEEYSDFCIRHLHRYLDTPHCLLIQYDGYVLKGQAWQDDFLKYDYIGSPWGNTSIIGNGGFSLRSKRLLEAASRIPDKPHPEDDFICRRHRRDLEQKGMRWPSLALAHQFAVEGASFVWQDHAWNSDGRCWKDQFGFHSYLTPLPGVPDKPLIFHHSGDLGDIIYGLAVMKALGGGVLFLSSDNRHPFPGRERVRLTHPICNQYTPFFEMQDYVWQAKYTPNLPYSTDVDLNAFREFYRTRNQDNFASLFTLHQKAFGLSYPEDRPWLTVDKKTVIPGKPIVVNRTARYHNDHFPWKSLVTQYGGQMAFVGSPQEVAEFAKFGQVYYQPTPNLVDLASVIAGAKVFIGNQSAPMALALGLGQNVIQECWQANPNCCFKRHNVILFGITTVSSNIAIPPEWLKVVDK